MDLVGRIDPSGVFSDTFVSFCCSERPAAPNQRLRYWFSHTDCVCYLKNISMCGSSCEYIYTRPECLHWRARCPENDACVSQTIAVQAEPCSSDQSQPYSLLKVTVPTITPITAPIITCTTPFPVQLTAYHTYINRNNMIWLKAVALQYHSTESYFWIILSLSGYLFCLFLMRWFLKQMNSFTKKKVSKQIWNFQNTCRKPQCNSIGTCPVYICTQSDPLSRWQDYHSLKRSIVTTSPVTY